MKKRTSSTIIWTITGVLVLVLMACANTGTYTAQTAAQPPAITSTALRPIVEAAQVDQYLQAIQAQATLDAVHAQQTATVIAQIASATAQAREDAVAALSRSATATAKAWEYAATEQAIRATAMAQAWQATATAETQLAQAAARAEAGHATATARAWEATATVEIIVFNTQATATKAADNAIATVQAARAKKEELDAKIAELVYPLKAYGPWILLALAAGLMVFGFYRFIVVMEARQRVIQSTGDKNVIVIDPSGRVIQPQNAFGPVLDPQQRILPPTADEQLTVTQNAQHIAAIRATHPPQESGRSDNHTTRRRRYQEAAGTMQRPQLQHHNKPQTPGLRQVYDLRTLEHARQAGLLTPQMAQALETDWQRQIVEGEYREV